MAVAFRAATTGGGSSAASVTCTAPAGLANDDILRLVVYKENTATPTYPTGFTEVGQITASDTSFRTYIAYKRAASESGSYVTSWTGSAWCSAALLAYSGAKTSGDPDDATPTKTANGSVIISATYNGPAITTITDNSMVETYSFNLQSNRNTKPTGYTSRVGFDAIDAADKIKTPAGDTGALTWTNGSLTTQITTITGALTIASGATTYTETGFSAWGNVSAGADVETEVDTGRSVAGLVSSGADVGTFPDSGAAIAGLVSAGADIGTFPDSGSSVVGLTSSGGDVGGGVDGGAGVTGWISAGADAQTGIDAGAAVMGWQSAGADIAGFIDGGFAIWDMIASGADSSSGTTYTETGFSVWGNAAGGADVLAGIDTGYSTWDVTAAGTTILTAIDGGYAVWSMIASGAENMATAGAAAHPVKVRELGAEVGQDIGVTEQHGATVARSSGIARGRGKKVI